MCIRDSHKTNNGTKQGPRGAADRHIPRQIGGRIQLASWQTKYDAQNPRVNSYDTDNRNIRVEVRTAADPERAICDAIMLGKVDATGSYNVDGHAESIEDLQERLRDLHAQKIARLNSTTRPAKQPDRQPSSTHTTNKRGATQSKDSG